MAGRPRKVNTEESESPETEEASTSDYELTFNYEHRSTNDYGSPSGTVTIYAVLTYNGETIADRRFDTTLGEDAIVNWAHDHKFAHEVALGNIPPKTIKLED